VLNNSEVTTEGVRGLHSGFGLDRFKRNAFNASLTRWLRLGFHNTVPKNDFKKPTKRQIRFSESCLLTLVFQIPPFCGVF